MVCGEGSVGEGGYKATSKLYVCCSGGQVTAL